VEQESGGFWADVSMVAALPVAVTAGVAKGTYDAVTGGGPFETGYAAVSKRVVGEAKKFGGEHGSAITKGLLTGVTTAIGGRIVSETLKRVLG
jgi:hypothetical protein